MVAFFILLFITSAFLILCTYVFYPIILLFISKNHIKIHRDIYPLPFISIIISAYNEEKDIKEKITNILDIDYPKDRFDIIVGSDGSMDQTVNIAKEFKNKKIKILDFKENRGKTAVQNDCVKHARGDILVFTDAASFFEKKSIKYLVANFADEEVGCVAGKLMFVNTGRNMNTQSQGVYWKYELMIRKLESTIGSLIGVDGPLYAIRKENFVYLANHIISDFISPLLVLQQGKKVVLEEKAVILEEPTIKSGQEFNTRRRIALRAFQGLKEHNQLLNPLKNFRIATQIIFHKLVRWLVGTLVVINFLSLLMLKGEFVGFYNLFILLYLIFILLAGIGYLLNKLKIKFKLFSIPYYFFLVNAAATLGFIDFIRNKQAVSWKPVRN